MISAGQEELAGSDITEELLYGRGNSRGPAEVVTNSGINPASSGCQFCFGSMCIELVWVIKTCHVTDVAFKTSKRIRYIMLTEDGGPGLDKLLSKAGVKFKSGIKKK